MDLELDKIETQINFDFKAFGFKYLSYWPYVLLFIFVGCFYVYQLNIRERKLYLLSTQISVEDDKNPLFSSNTNLTFNWGGVTGKVQTVLVSLKSRDHNEKVVDRLKFYVSYLKQNRFRKDDIYKAAPFRFYPTGDMYQLLETPVKITFKENGMYELEVNFESSIVVTQSCLTYEKSKTNVGLGVFKKQYKLGSEINESFFKGIIDVTKDGKVSSGDEYYIRFNDYNTLVARYRREMSIGNQKGSPIINISLVGINKAKAVDYLNTTVDVLREDQLTRKNQFATNTIAFIDDRLKEVKQKMKLNATALNNYRRKNKIFNLDDESARVSSELKRYEEEVDIVNEKITYCNHLKDYLLNSDDFTDVPAPALAGIEDGNIVKNISKINELSVQKSKLEYSVREGASIFDDLERQIEGLKMVLFENIDSAMAVLKLDLMRLKAKLTKVESRFKKLPEDQQKILNIERQYLLTEKDYNVYLAKKGEASIIKAANVSDILVIDYAKDVGGAPIGNNFKVRYVFAILTGLFVPLIIAFLVIFFDNTMHTPNDIEQLSAIPLLGVVGKNSSNSNLIVHEKPKSVISESFRAIRSGLQFLYKKHNLEGSKTVLLTSSVSGEGKTFCSMNIATVFALSGKKTVLVGLDLRKPKIFDDFKLKNDVGAVNYLINQASLEEVVQPSLIENLDVILSGPIPPNPSELLIGEVMDKFMTELKKRYDYIVLDTPPVGLVSDALELVEYADAVLYLVRQNYTKKGMLQLINDKYKKKEIKNISFIYNYFNQKGSYGYGYGYGYGYSYGYGAYANGYHEVEDNKGVFNKLKKILKKQD